MVGCSFGWQVQSRLQSDRSDILSLPSDLTIDQMLIFRQTSSFQSVCETGAPVINSLISRISNEREILYSSTSKNSACLWARLRNACRRIKKYT